MNVTYYNDGTDSKGHYLESTVENEYGDVVSQKKVYYPLVKFESHQKLYFLQYNDKMELIYEVCNYLNYYINESSEQTRDFKAKTLRNYLCFMALGGFDYTDLTDQYVLERIYSFFRGDDFRCNHRKNIRHTEYFGHFGDNTHREAGLQHLLQSRFPDFNGGKTADDQHN